VRFLESLSDGQPVTRAAEEAEIPCRTAYNWRREDEAFARAWDEAWEQGTDRLEAVALERAVNGSDLLLIFLMKGRRPTRYRDNVRHEVDARLTVSVEDARAQLEERLAAIEDRRALRALPAQVDEAPAIAADA
jgi:hypothetical protein